MSQLKVASVALLVAAALVGGVAGAGATWALSSPHGARAKELPADDPAADRGGAEVEGESAALRRIERLEAELRALKRRSTSTEALHKYASVLAKGNKGEKPTDVEGEQPRDELAPVMDAEDPTFELAVRTVLDRVDWEREEERRVTQTKRREERAQRQTDLLAERLRLSAAQKQSVQSVLIEQMETFRKLRSGEDDTARPTTRGEWRTRIEAIRTETEKKLAEVLDDEQMSSYRQFVEEEGFGPRGGRGRRSGSRDSRQGG